MKKLKHVIKFIRSAKTVKGRLTLIMFLARSLFEFPAFLFHELMHFLVAIPFGEGLKVIKWKFFSSPPDDVHKLHSYELAIQYSAPPIISIIGSAAPIIGWTISVVFLSLTGHWIILSYFFLAFRLFFLSAGDIECMKTNGFNEKICDALLKFQKKLRTDANVNVN